MEILYTKTAAKAISAMDKQTKQRIKKGIEAIPQGDIVVLQGCESIYRLRIGKYRIIFEYREIYGKKVLYILDIDSRGDVYK